MVAETSMRGSIKSRRSSNARAGGSPSYLLRLSSRLRAGGFFKPRGLDKSNKEIEVNLLDPRLFNFIIMGLYLLNTCWWAYNKNWPQTLYWCAAFQITAAVTWGVSK